MIQYHTIHSELSLSGFKIVILIALLLVAVWFDIRSRRIPNSLVLIGLLVSLGIQLIDSSANLSHWLLGMLTGFGLLIPLYLIRAMGAGDVKLMAMVGSFIGVYSTVEAALATVLCGGLLAILVSLWNGTLKKAIENIKFLIGETIFNTTTNRIIKIDHPQISAGNLPYAVAITSGTVAQLFIARNGNGIFF